MFYSDPIEEGTEGLVTKFDGCGLLHVVWKYKKTNKNHRELRGVCVDPEVDLFEILD